MACMVMDPRKGIDVGGSIHQSIQQRFIAMLPQEQRMDPLMLAIQCMFPVLDSQMLDPQELAIQPREQKEAIWGDSIGGRGSSG